MIEKFKIGFSPCPNDTYIFDALVNNKLDFANPQYSPIIADVEELNRFKAENEECVKKIQESEGKVQALQSQIQEMEKKMGISGDAFSSKGRSNK